MLIAPERAKTEDVIHFEYKLETRNQFLRNDLAGSRIKSEAWWRWRGFKKVVCGRRVNNRKL